jgi:ClpP class serine protease
MWLTRQSIAEAIEHARAKALVLPQTVMDAFNRRHFEAAASGDPRILTRAGDVAEILVEGILTPKPDYYAYYYGNGNTTYPEIIRALQLAGSDPNIKRIVLNVCSPGGYVGGLFDTLAALEAFPKPKETYAAMADSAAFAIAALGGKITATNTAAEFGSVGVCATYVQYDFEKVFEITSSNAPNKRPDPSTPEGQAVIRTQLDAFEDLFIDAIARGRGTTKDDVKANFGRGGVLLAADAKRAKMIDRIAKAPQRAAMPTTDDNRDAALGAGEPAAVADTSPGAAPVPTSAAPSVPVPAPAVPAPIQNASAASGGAAKAKKKMTEEELRAQHPELYSAVLNKGKAEAKADADKATAEEKDRIEAHLTAGEQSGDMKTAIASIRSGDKMSQTLMAKYMMAGMRKSAVDARTEDDKVAADATSTPAAGADKGKTKKELVAEAVVRAHSGEGAASA